MPEKPPAATRAHADVGAAVVAVVTTAIAAAALWQAHAFSPLGSIFPRTVGIALVLSSLAVLWRAATGRSTPSRGIPRDGLARSLLLVTTMVMWIALLTPVGFVVTSTVAFLALAIVADREPMTLRRLVAFALTAVVVVGLFDLVFERALNVNLPRGLLI